MFEINFAPKQHIRGIQLSLQPCLLCQCLWLSQGKYRCGK